MPIAWQWREATGTDVSMQLIESRADNLPPHWQVTIQGDAGAVVALSGKSLDTLAMADLGAVTFYDGTATLRLSPLVADLSATCDTAISVIVVGDLPMTLRPESNPTTAARPATEWQALHPPPDPIAEAKAAKRAQITAERDAACVAPVQALGHTWQADPGSQALLTKAVTLASVGLPLPEVWRSRDNYDMPVDSIGDLLAIAGAMAAQTQAAYATSWARKDALAAAETIEEIDAV